MSYSHDDFIEPDGNALEGEAVSVCENCGATFIGTGNDCGVCDNTKSNCCEVSCGDIDTHNTLFNGGHSEFSSF